MKKNFQNSIFTRYLWGFMSLYLFNCSVDSPDAHSHPTAQDLSYNDQESIVEIFVEKILGFENAFTEYDDNGTNDGIVHKSTIALDLFVLPNTSLHLNQEDSYFKKNNLTCLSGPIIIPYFEIHTPPPEV